MSESLTTNPTSGVNAETLAYILSRAEALSDGLFADYDHLIENSQFNLTTAAILLGLLVTVANPENISKWGSSSYRFLAAAGVLLVGTTIISMLIQWTGRFLLPHGVPKYLYTNFAMKSLSELHSFQLAVIIKSIDSLTPKIIWLGRWLNVARFLIVAATILFVFALTTIYPLP